MNKRTWWFTLTGVLALGQLACGSDDGSDADGSGEPEALSMEPPDGYAQFGVLMANAEVPLEMVAPVDGEKFHREIMGRDDDEYETVREEAIAFFEERFGIENVDQDPNFVFRSYQVEPFSNYRMYQFTDENVPTSGWEVRDGGWMAVVINPEGYTYEGGWFDGVWSPPGTFMTYGDYNILTDDCGDEVECDDPREIRVRYESRCPVEVEGPELPEALSFSWSCDLYSEDFGFGLGQGIAEPKLSDDGKSFQYNARNVWTFSELGGF